MTFVVFSSFLKLSFAVIPDLGSWIRDPGSKNSYKREGWTQFVVIPFFVATNFTKFKLFYFWTAEKIKIGAKFQRIKELFTQNVVTMLSKIWVWDPGSEIRDPEKSLSPIQGSKRHRIQDPGPDPQHCLKFWLASLKQYCWWLVASSWYRRGGNIQQCWGSSWVTPFVLSLAGHM